MRTLLIFAIVPILSAVGWATPDTSPVVEALPKPPLAFSQYAIVHGEVQARPVIEATFRFTNRSSQSVEITKLQPSCGCLRPTLSGGTKSADNHTFAAGESGTFTISVETANESPGAHDYSVVVHSSQGDTSHEQQVNYAVVLPAKKVSISPQSLLFYQLQQEPGEKFIELFDPRENQANVTSVSIDHPLASAKVVDSSTPGVTNISVAVEAGLSPGQSRSMLVIETDDSEYPRIRVPVFLQGPSE